MSGKRSSEAARIAAMAGPSVLSAVIQYTLGSVLLAFVGNVRWGGGGFGLLPVNR